MFLTSNFMLAVYLQNLEKLFEDMGEVAGAGYVVVIFLVVELYQI